MSNNECSCNNIFVLFNNLINYAKSYMYYLSFSVFMSIGICPPLKSTSVDISCSHKEEMISCTKHILCLVQRLC